MPAPSEKVGGTCPSCPPPNCAHCHEWSAAPISVCLRRGFPAPGM